MNKEPDESKGCAWIIVALAIAFAIIVSTLKYWNIK